MFDIGSSLREARERRGLTSADVQKAIRIRDRYLNALEEERWELLPGDAYVKGFLRTYADFLGLDGNLYVEEYTSRFAHHDDQVIVPQALARRSSAGLGVGLVRPLVALGVIAAVVAAVAAWQLRGHGGSHTVRETTTHTQSTTTTATTTRHGHKPKHPTHAVLPTHATLSATRGACWVEIREGSRSGALVYEGTLQQGQTRTLTLASGPFWIDVGDPPSLDIRMGGRIVPGLPAQAGVVVLTRRGLRAG